MSPGSRDRPEVRSSKARLRQVLCIAGSPYGGRFAARFALLQWLRRIHGLRLHIAANIEVVRRRNLSRFDGIVIYLPHHHISAEALEVLRGFVSQGGALVSVHTSAQTGTERSWLSAILGGRVLGELLRGSRKAATYTVHYAGDAATVTDPVDRTAGEPGAVAPIFPPMEDFVIVDELDVHELDAENRVHFVAETQNGTEPIAWTRAFGRGRVFYLAPGERAATLRHPSIRRILRQGVLWAVQGTSDGRKPREGAS